MQVQTFHICRVAVLGAGVMEAQIASHFANANVPVVLFDLPAKEDDKNSVLNKALAGLKSMDPAPLVGTDTLQHIDAANYERHVAQLADCDLMVEAFAERMDWKHEHDWIELNEAFAAQSLAVIQDLGVNPDAINPLGGAIGTATVVHGLQRTGGRNF